MLNIKQISFLTVLIVLFLCGESYSQEMSIAVSYLRGEKSKDSFSATENYALNGTSLSFSTKYTGRMGNEDPRSRVCTLQDKDTTALRNLIFEYGLNVTDSLISETTKSSFPQYYTAINMSISVDGVESKITVNGDTYELAESEYYKKVIKFIMYLRNTALNCIK